MLPLTLTTGLIGAGTGTACSPSAVLSLAVVPVIEQTPITMLGRTTSEPEAMSRLFTELVDSFAVLPGTRRVPSIDTFVLSGPVPIRATVDGGIGE